MKKLLAALAFLAACHEVDKPVVTAPTGSATPVTTTAPSAAATAASPSSTERTPSSCSEAATGKPDLAGCKWTVVEKNCVCNGCLADTDCSVKAGGACTTLSATKGRMPSAKACLYPGDDCFGGAACAKGRSCAHDGMGRSTTCMQGGDVHPH